MQLFDLRCSNCGFMNKYSQEELENAFPNSRERLICDKCRHTLSINSYFVDDGKIN